MARHGARDAAPAATGSGLLWNIPLARPLSFGLNSWGAMTTAADQKHHSTSQAAVDVFDGVSRGIFGIAAGILMLFAVVLTFDAVVQFALALWARKSVGVAALSGIGYVVVSIAVFDVAKYLIEEEVVRGRQMRVASEARRSLTRFISTIAIAIFLEALVTVFRVSQESVPHLIYPTILLVAGILLVLGLGIYQRLSADVEKQVDSKDKQAGEAVAKPRAPARR
jgi:hypothetical protein